LLSISVPIRGLGYTSLWLSVQRTTDGFLTTQRPLANLAAPGNGCRIDDNRCRRYAMGRSAIFPAFDPSRAIDHLMKNCRIIDVPLSPQTGELPRVGEVWIRARFEPSPPIRGSFNLAERLMPLAHRADAALRDRPLSGPAVRRDRRWGDHRGLKSEFGWTLLRYITNSFKSRRAFCTLHPSGWRCDRKMR
jgi:hypothetical protein